MFLELHGASGLFLQNTRSLLRVKTGKNGCAEILVESDKRTGEWLTIKESYAQVRDLLCAADGENALGVFDLNQTVD